MKLKRKKTNKGDKRGFWPLLRKKKGNRSDGQMRERVSEIREEKVERR